MRGYFKGTDIPVRKDKYMSAEAKLKIGLASKGRIYSDENNGKTVCKDCHRIENKISKQLEFGENNG